MATAKNWMSAASFISMAGLISLMITDTLIPHLGFGSTSVDGLGVYLPDRPNGLNQEPRFHTYTDRHKFMIAVFFITAGLTVGTAPRHEQTNTLWFSALRPAPRKYSWTYRQ